MLEFERIFKLTKRGQNSDEQCVSKELEGIGRSLFE
jgi:hypothetical protein